MDNCLVVEAKYEERSDKNEVSSRLFTCQYLLPENVVTKKLKSFQSSDGVLSIKAPKKLETIEFAERVIPIQQIPADRATDKTKDAKK